MIPSAEQVTELFETRYPECEVTVKRIFGGLQIEVHGEGSTIVAVVGDERSAILAAFADISQAS
jgi:hypothetical protein